MGAIYKASDREIVASVGESFTIELEGNPSTGYQWQVQFDPRKVRLVNREHELAGGGFGAGARELFTFQPLGSGPASISAEYKRAWETSALQKREFRLRIEEPRARKKARR